MVVRNYTVIFVQRTYEIILFLDPLTWILWLISLRVHYYNHVLLVCSFGLSPICWQIWVVWLVNHDIIFAMGNQYLLNTTLILHWYVSIQNDGSISFFTRYSNKTSMGDSYSGKKVVLWDVLYSYETFCKTSFSASRPQDINRLSANQMSAKAILTNNRVRKRYFDIFFDLCVTYNHRM